MIIIVIMIIMMAIATAITNDMKRKIISNSYHDRTMTK